MISLRGGKEFLISLVNYMHCWIENHDLMYRPRIKSGNHPFRSAARVVQRQLRECWEN
jgi:hypothetical protein